MGQGADRGGADRIEELFEHCLALGPNARHSILAGARARDPELARELESLLAAHAEDPSFLGTAGTPAPPALSRLVHALLGPEAELGRVVDPLLAPERESAPRAERYEVRGELGRGGMGVVLRAFDPELEREIALKRLPAIDARRSDATPPRSARTLGRFLKEARVTAALDHPGVIPVHELGLDGEGHVYFTMRLVQGRELGAAFEMARRRIDGWNVTRALEALLKVCDAVAYAHSRGVVHRDLKPQNVLVGRFGEVYVMDWGVAQIAGARDLAHLRPRVASGGDASPLVTEDGDVIGTPAYMSPEQARGQVEEVDAKSDVYAIGALLYELLAGHPPYIEPGSLQSSRALLECVRSTAPAPIEARAPDQPAELAAICSKAMARAADERYASVEELAAELRAFLDGRVVRAYESGALAELRKWVRRNRALATVAVVAIVSVMVGLASTAYVQAAARDAATRTRNELVALNTALANRNQELVDERERARAFAAEAERQSQAAGGAVRFLISLFSAPDPVRAREEPVSALELLENGAASIDAAVGLDPLARVELMCAMGLAYLNLDALDRSDRLLSDAHAFALEAAGPRSAEAVFAANSLVSLRQRRGDIDGAAELAEAALATSEELFGAEGSATLDAVDQLATVRMMQSRSAEALLLYDRSLEGRRRLSGDHDVWTLATRRKRGSVLCSLGRYDESRTELEATLALQEQIFGEEHAQTLETIDSLALLLIAQAQYEEAERLLSRLWEIRKRISGPEHGSTLDTSGALATTYMNQGRFAEALELLEHELETRERFFGPGHYTTILARLNLGSCLASLGRGEDALSAMWRTYEDARERVGETHALAVKALGYVAVLSSGLAPVEEVDGLYAEALEAHRSVFGSEGRDTLSLLNNYGVHLEHTGRSVQAEPFWREAFDGLRRLHPDHPLTLIAQENLVRAHVSAGRWREAHSLLSDLIARAPAGTPPRTEHVSLLQSIERELDGAGGGEDR